MSCRVVSDDSSRLVFCIYIFCAQVETKRSLDDKVTAAQEISRARVQWHLILKWFDAAESENPLARTRDNWPLIVCGARTWDQRKPRVRLVYITHNAQGEINHARAREAKEFAPGCACGETSLRVAIKIVWELLSTVYILYIHHQKGARRRTCNKALGRRVLLCGRCSAVEDCASSLSLSSWPRGGRFKNPIEASSLRKTYDERLRVLYIYVIESACALNDIRAHLRAQISVRVPLGVCLCDFLIDPLLFIDTLVVNKCIFFFKWERTRLWGV